MQQAYARVRGNQQFLSVAELLDDALHLLKDSFAAHRIEVVRRYDPVPQIEVDRHRLMQIINNLLKNALESMTSGDYRGRRIEVCVGSDEEGWVRIEVRDNGEGIGPEHLGKIFSYGFTTKETGHGFGLHGCANAVKEMGGAIRVHSDGMGKGASFTIRLPVVLEGVEA
jgi:signal transduction histidine kinase